ncbi:MAG: hypothetical protein K6G88_10825 [Lachnospiraceae bacterium]|nr:hypothetical protein [Lachnospiraceae bacterium]
MRLNKKNIIIFCVVIALVALNGCSVNQKSAFPTANEVTEIKISQEIVPHESLTVDNIDDFIENMQFDKWEKINDFSLKSSPEYYISFGPSDKVIGLISYDASDEVCYAKYENNYYSYPKEVYNYIMKDFPSK